MTRYPPTSWPDPEPAPGRPQCDDVTRLNATEVEAVYCVRSRADVQRVLALARAAGRTVSMRGACHTMGGQTLTPGGIVIDMGKLAHMELDRDSGLLIVGPGTLWSDVLLYLNQYGRSPRTMQSYSTFSVGGSISVNAHGITSDCCMAECVVSLELVGWDGRVHTCGRDAATAEGRALFGAVIGGYGMFGVMTSVTLKTSVNTPLTMEHVLTTSAEEFARVYSSLRGRTRTRTRTRARIRTRIRTLTLTLTLSLTLTLTLTLTLALPLTLTLATLTLTLLAPLGGGDHGGPLL